MAICEISKKNRQATARMVDTVRAANFLLQTGKTNDAGEMLTELIKIYDEEEARLDQD